MPRVWRQQKSSNHFRAMHSAVMLSDSVVTVALEIVATTAYDNGTKAAKAATSDTTNADTALCTFA